MQKATSINNGIPLLKKMYKEWDAFFRFCRIILFYHLNALNKFVEGESYSVV